MEQNHMKRLIPLAVLLALLALGLAPGMAQNTQTPAEICEAATPAEAPTTRAFDAAEDVLEDGVDYQAIFCTDVGPIHIELFEDETPVTVNNFVFLAESGFYNNSIFHRVLPNFMAQGGDPVGNPAGTGGPGYQFEDEFDDTLTFDVPGKLAMANAGPGTNGSQFFITTAPTPHLQNLHTIFGEVITGEFVVLSIQIRDPQAVPPDAPATTLETVVIITDPDSVEHVDFVPEPATREEIEAAVLGLPETMPGTLESLGAGLSAFLGTDADATVIMDADERAESAGADGFADYLTSHGHEFSGATVLNNADCELDILPLATISYVIDVYATPEDAEAAINDEALAELQAEQGLEAIEAALDYPVFAGTASACDNEGLVLVRAFQQRGRFILQAETAYVPDAVVADPAEGAPLVLDQFAYIIIEAALDDIIRPELAR
jgi:cyclophilin family peptidyl-prolyl cis-trans isomerase